jgi:hypothetical protein
LSENKTKGVGVIKKSEFDLVDFGFYENRILFYESKFCDQPFLTSLLNDCVTTCHFIEEFKQAILTPLYKG